VTRGQPTTRAPLREGAGVARNALFLVSGQLATTAISFAVTAVLAWHLGAADYGVFFLAATLAQSAFVLADFGQEYYVVGRIAQDPTGAATLLGSGLLVRLAASVVIVPLLAGLAAVLGYPETTGAAIWLTVASFFLASIRDGVTVVLRGLERMEVEAVLRVVSTILVAGAIAVAVVGGGGLAAVLVMQALGAAAALVACWFAIRRVGIAWPRPSLPIAVSILWGGAPFLLQAAVISSQSGLDAILLSVLVPSSVIGWHGAAWKLVGTLLIPANVLAAALFPALARLQASANYGAILEEGLRATVVLGFLCAAGTFLFADAAIALVYGTEVFGPAAGNLRVLAVYLPLVFLNIVLGAAIMAAGRLTPWIRAKLVSVVVAVVVSLVLIPLSQSSLGNGGLGVAAGTVAAELVMFAAALRLVPFDRARLRGRLPKDLGRGALAAVAMAAAAWATRDSDVVLRIGMSVAVYLASACLLGAIRREDVRVIRDVVRFRPLG
jgi:O-antigen/teichoic acid export membrane protein